VGYNVQVAVETTHHLIISHEVINEGSDRSQLTSVAKQAKATLDVENLDVVADRGYFGSEEILACENAGITVTLPFGALTLSFTSEAMAYTPAGDFREARSVCAARLTYFLGPLYPARLAVFIASNMVPGVISTVVFVARIWPGAIADSMNAVTVVSSGASKITNPSYSPNE
jgi:hypothetical protein